MPTSSTLRPRLTALLSLSFHGTSKYSKREVLEPMTSLSNSRTDLGWMDRLSLKEGFFGLGGLGFTLGGMLLVTGG